VSFYELGVYMHDQLLRDTDQMSMAHGLEVRVPLIGREVVETVAGLGDIALSGSGLKPLLAGILGTYLPMEPFATRKQGFTLNWDELLVEHRKRDTGRLGPLLRPEGVERVWSEFRSGKRSFAACFALEAASAWFSRATAGVRPAGRSVAGRGRPLARGA
jgi:asparagine synthase (glutamine-hydrolysing)